MNLLLFELKLAWRRLVRRWTHSTLILTTSTVSIAFALLSAALFSAIFLRNPNYDPDGSLYIVRQVTPDGKERQKAYLSEVDAWAAGQRVFSEFGVIKSSRSTLVRTPEGTVQLAGAHLSHDALRMVNAKPLIGRLFTEEEDQWGSEPVILLSHSLWQTRYGGDLSVVGRSLVVNSVATTIVGVMPSEFRFPNEEDLWASLGFDPTSGRTTVPSFDVIVRLQPGVTPKKAEADLRQISEVSRRGEMSRRELRPIIQPYRDVHISAEAKAATTVLFAISLLFVLMSCTNTANLILVDFLSRADALGTAASLGVPPIANVRGEFWRLAILTGASTAMAFGVVMLSGPIVFASVKVPGMPSWMFFSSGVELWFVALSVGVTSVFAGVIGPALVVYSMNPDDFVRHGLLGVKGSIKTAWRRGLLIGQVSLLTVLGCAAGLLVKSQNRIAELALGFDPTYVQTLTVSLASEDFQQGGSKQQAFERILDGIRRLPGVTHAALCNGMPGVRTGGEAMYDTIRSNVENRSATRSARQSLVTDEFFSLLKVKWVAGESFPRDMTSAHPEYAVITRGLAELLWPEQEALGRTLYSRLRSDNRGRIRPLVVRGIVENFRTSRLLEVQQDAIYIHISKDGYTAYNLFVRGVNQTPYVETIRRTIQRTEPRISTGSGRALNEAISSSQAVLHLISQLTIIFTVAAGVLTAIGIYSLTTVLLVQRTREFGIRLALGGIPENLWLRLAGSHLADVTFGAIVGIVIAASTAPVLGTLLYRVPTRDIMTFTSVAFLIIVLAVLACLPSWWKMRRIDPAICLRNL